MWLAFFMVDNDETLRNCVVNYMIGSKPFKWIKVEDHTITAFDQNEQPFIFRRDYDNYWNIDGRTFNQFAMYQHSGAR